jgi:hypothetical protein
LMGTRLLCSEQAFKMVGLDAHSFAVGLVIGHLLFRPKKND